MARAVDLSAFEGVRSFADYDKAAIEEARQRYMDAQKMKILQNESNIKNQMYELDKQKFEAEKAQPDQLFGGNSFQGQLGNLMHRLGVPDPQIVQALTMKGIALQNGEYRTYSPIDVVGGLPQQQQAPRLTVGNAPEPLQGPANQSAPAGRGMSGPPDIDAIKNEVGNIMEGRGPTRTIVEPIDPAEKAASIETAKGNAELELKKTASIPAKQRLSSVLSDLTSLYASLDKGGGSVNTSKDTLSNIGSYTANTAIGQGVGQMFGTQNQSIRNDISAKIPLISAAIKDATGMSSQQMNSNFELQQYLKALSSPTNDIQANLKILSDLEKMFGTSSLQQQMQQPTQQEPQVLNWEDMK